MRKSQELTDPQSCMSKANDAEMTFVLLERDWASPSTIRFWISERIRIGKNKPGDPQLLEAEMCAREMESNDVLVCPKCELGIRGTTNLKEGDACPGGCKDPDGRLATLSLPW